MKNGMVIIDADGHAVDYEPVYRERLPEQYRNRTTIYPSDNFDRTHNRKIAHRDFWPFYEECARQGVAVSFHASGSDTLDALCHFDNFLQVHTLSHAPEQLIACTAVIYSGLLEKFQDLRVAFLDAGIGWVPFWMEHMDEECEFRPFDAPLLKAKPSEYMTCGRVFVSW